MSHPLLSAVVPLADAVGGKVIDVDEMDAGDIPLEWLGQVVGAVRLAGAVRDLEWYLSGVSREFGSPLDELSREEKQRVVKVLDERGAFALRRSVEQVAEVLGVSRFTVYNYLNR